MTLYETRGREPQVKVWRSLTQRDLDQLMRCYAPTDLRLSGVLAGQLLKVDPDLNLYHFNGTEKDVLAYLSFIRDDENMIVEKRKYHDRMNGIRRDNGVPELPFYLDGLQEEG